MASDSHFNEDALWRTNEIQTCKLPAWGDSVFENYPSMLYKTVSGTSSFQFVDNSLALCCGEFDFTTYFNALSITKWIEYTVAKTFYLHLEYKGSSFKLCQRFANSYDLDSQIVIDSEREARASDEWVSLDIQLNQLSSKFSMLFRSRRRAKYAYVTRITLPMLTGQQSEMSSWRLRVRRLRKKTISERIFV